MQLMGTATDNLQILINPEHPEYPGQKEEIAEKICKLLITDEALGMEYLEIFHKKYGQVNNTGPLVSILVTSYNTAGFILPCIHTLLYQTYSHIEIILIDDGSTDGTMDILKSIRDYRVRIFSIDKNIGRVAALNLGLSACNGEYIALMDSDDMASPIRIESLLTYCMDNKLDAVSSQLFKFNTLDRNFYTVSSFSDNEKELKVKMLFYNAVPHAACLFKASTIKDTGYRHGFDFAEDYEMLSRYIGKYKTGLVNQPLYIYRQRSYSATDPRNETTSISSQKKVQEALFKRYLFDPSKQELDLHACLEKNLTTPIADREHLIHTRKWIQKIIRYNRHTKAFDAETLEKILLHNYWAGYYYHNTSLHGLYTGLKLIPYQDFKTNIITLKESIKASIKTIPLLRYWLKYRTSEPA
jgi:glycosyltransferase involved in cell wall biosynthesis